MHDTILQNAFAIVPTTDKLTVLNVTSSSQAVDLSSTPSEVWPYLAAGRMITVSCEADDPTAAFTVFFRFSSVTGTAAQSALSGSANQAFSVSNGEKLSFFLGDNYPFLIFIGSGDGYLRLAVSSRNPDAQGSDI